MSSFTKLKMPRWLMGENPLIANDPVHYMIHQKAPRFTARWCFGPPSTPPKDDSRMFVEKGEGDSVHIFDILWIDNAPEDEKKFNKLMNDGIDAIDLWLENNSAPPTR